MDIFGMRYVSAAKFLMLARRAPCGEKEGGGVRVMVSFLSVCSDTDDAVAALPVQPKRRRETLQDRILSSPLSPQYLLWKERTIRSAEMKIKSI